MQSTFLFAFSGSRTLSLWIRYAQTWGSSGAAAVVDQPCKAEGTVLLEQGLVSCGEAGSSRAT